MGERGLAMHDRRFLVLEGLDGSGITTQAEMLRMWCEARGIPVYITKEPSEGPVGVLIKSALKKRISFDPETIALLFAADRLDHVRNEILPQLENGKVVVSDRYYLSSLAYQSAEVGDLRWMRLINSKAPHPVLTIYIDVPPEVCLRRMKSHAWRGADQLQLYEEVDKLSAVRDRFISIISDLKNDGHEVEVIKGTDDVNAIAEQILELAERFLGGLATRHPQPEDTNVLPHLIEGHAAAG